MKFIGFFSFFLFVFTYFTSYANENKYIFIGQTEQNGIAKTAFILQLLRDDFENYVYISESGEVYLKVDKIIAASEEYTTTQNTIPLTHMFSPGEEKDVRCSNPKCHYVYRPRPGKLACPKCGTENYPW